MKNRMNREKGMTIVEASIVFPVMFLVIFLMIFTGNAYLQKCKIESCANQLAIKGASYCADPLLKSVEGGRIPSHTAHNVYPYRYLFTGEIGNIESQIKSEFNTAISKIGSGVFRGMKPTSLETNVKYNNGFIYSTFSIAVQYKVKIPIKLLGAEDFLYMKIATCVDMPVSDSTEFIRNADMVEDYVQRTGWADKIQEVIDSATKWMSGK